MVATTKAGADELAAPLDLLLTSSAVGMADRLMPNVAWSRFALNLAKQPRTVASRAASLGRELMSIAEGRSELAPAKGDKRFADPAWRGNPLLHRTMQVAHHHLGERRERVAGLLRRHGSGQNAGADQEHMLLAEHADAIEKIFVGV